VEFAASLRRAQQWRSSQTDRKLLSHRAGHETPDPEGPWSRAAPSVGDGAKPERAESSLRERLETGNNAPDFTLPDQDGNLVSLEELKGTTVVLYFYPKADTRR